MSGRSWWAWPVALLAVPLVSMPLAWAGPDVAVKPSLELQVFLGDKAVGTEVVRTTEGKDVLYVSSNAELQDKVGKAWRAFKERSHLQLGPKGEVIEYDRWIDVTGATSQEKLFQFQGTWKISHQDPVTPEGKRPKPKVKELKLKAPFVVLDERLPSLVVLATDWLAKAGLSSCEYVRVDDGSTGKLAVTTEKLTNKAGASFQRTVLKGDVLKGDKVELEVLRDHAHKVVSVKGLDSWRAVAKDAKVPKDLQVVAVPPAAEETPTAP